MATINIKYNPALSVFFNSDGKLVIGDVNGDYGDGNENGWGGFNPPKSSVVSATFILGNQSNGDAFFLISGSDAFDLLAEGFYTTTNQVLIDATPFVQIINVFTLQSRPNNNVQFEQGVYTVSFSIQGSYTMGGDTINWITEPFTIPVFITDLVNLNSNCIEDTLRKVSFAKRCKTNKKFSNLNMYFNMLYEFQKYITLSNSWTGDYTQRVVKINDILDEIKGLCNGKNNCKC